MILNAVPKTLEKALDCIPISQIVKQGASLQLLEASLALEILKTSNLLSVGGNIKQGQSLEIAKRVIGEYPNECFEDFCLMLQNGVKGKYPIDGKNDIFRFDMLVIMNWMRSYLEEKYVAVENKLMKEKDQHYKTLMDVQTDNDWLGIWYKKVVDGDGMKQVPEVSEQEAKKEGQEKPKKEVYPSTSRSELAQKLLHLEYIKHNYDGRTGEKLPTWMSENDWLTRRK